MNTVQRTIIVLITADAHNNTNEAIKKKKKFVDMSYS